MEIIDATSLAATLDRLNEAFFHGTPLSGSQREQAAKWLAGRQGLPGSYAGMFAPTEKDIRRGIQVFTGEKVRSRAATCHILGEEACRALILLGVRLAGVQEALRRATAGMATRLEQARQRPSGIPGTYCCGTCTCSLWRHLAAGGLAGHEGWLAAGMKALKAHRLGNGRWRRFPFFYTLLALQEIDLPSAVDELRYAAPVCERLVKRSRKSGKHIQRRRLLAERALAKC
ncbi:MAG: hypothetical protein FJ279_14650 [Planctomycetes bacterium]|nr:hypothetical protein [Planctomycetota bacterium]